MAHIYQWPFKFCNDYCDFCLIINKSMGCRRGGLYTAYHRVRPTTTNTWVQLATLNQMLILVTTNRYNMTSAKINKLRWQPHFFWNCSSMFQLLVRSANALMVLLFSLFVAMCKLRPLEGPQVIIITFRVTLMPQAASFDRSQDKDTPAPAPRNKRWVTKTWALGSKRECSFRVFFAGSGPFKRFDIFFVL